MTPSFSRSDVGNDLFAETQQTRYRFPTLTSRKSFVDLNHFRFVDLCHAVSAAPWYRLRMQSSSVPVATRQTFRMQPGAVFVAACGCAMPDHVRMIFPGSSPAEIVETIVKTVTISVKALHAIRGGADEGEQDQSADLLRPGVMAKPMKFDPQITIARRLFQQPRDTAMIASLPADAPEVADAVDTLVAGNRKPSLGSGNRLIFSHDVDLSPGSLVVRAEVAFVA